VATPACKALVKPEGDTHQRLKRKPRGGKAPPLVCQDTLLRAHLEETNRPSIVNDRMNGHLQPWPLAGPALSRQRSNAHSSRNHSHKVSWRCRLSTRRYPVTSRTSTHYLHLYLYSTPRQDGLDGRSETAREVDQAATLDQNAETISNPVEGDSRRVSPPPTGDPAAPYSRLCALLPWHDIPQRDGTVWQGGGFRTASSSSS